MHTWISIDLLVYSLVAVLQCCRIDPHERRKQEKGIENTHSKITLLMVSPSLDGVLDCGIGKCVTGTCVTVIVLCYRDSRVL